MAETGAKGTGTKEKEQSEQITKTIEEIAPDDHSRIMEQFVEIDESDPRVCLKCGFGMSKIEACLSKCLNCGNVQDCSDML